jgi:hypothetical protein
LLIWPKWAIWPKWPIWLIWPILLDAGVVKATVIKQSKNPNRWAKHLAPWFNEACKEAKRAYRIQKRTYGKRDVRTKRAYRKFRQTCHHSRTVLSQELPNILKYKPK